MTALHGTLQERVRLPRSSNFPARPEETAITPGEVLAMLRRRAVLATILTLFLLGLSAAGFYVWWTYFPGYRSECLIECVSNLPKEGLTLEHERLRQEEHERFVATQAVVLKSPSILQEALRLTAVRGTTWFKEVTRRKKEPLIELTEQLVAAPARGTNFLRVSLETRDREDPAIIVDAVVDLWLDAVRSRSADKFAADLQAARAELDAFDARIADKRRQLEAIASRLPPGLRQNTANSIVAEEARTIAEQVAKLRLDLSQLEQIRAAYNNPAGLAATAEERALVEQDPQVVNLRQALLLLQQQHAADLVRFGARHVAVRRVEAQVTATEEKLAQIMDQKLAEIQSFNRQQANSAFLNTQQALFQAEERLMRAEAALQDQDQQLAAYTTLQEEIKEDTEYRKELVEHVTSLERVVRQRSAVDISVAQPATEPLQRSSPSLLLIPLAVFLSLAMGAGIPIGLEFMDKSVRTTRDVGRFLRATVLGAVPHTDDEEVAIARVETAVRDAPRSHAAEAFRTIRTNLQFATTSTRLRTAVVTSPRPEEGKTTVACNLAMVVAQGGKKTLLVDANFRRPALARLFGLNKAEGLSSILAGTATLEACVAPSGVAGLEIVGSGPMPPNPAELLGGDLCRAFFEVAVSRYDQVIFDTSPVFVATDALVLSAMADGVILVVRAKQCSRGAATRAWTLLSDVNAHPLGVVLNAAQIARGGYFREQLRTYYEYQDGAGKQT